MFETQEGNFVEVDWQGEWWQAKIKKLKVRQSSGAQMGSVNRSHLNSRGEQVIAVFVEYVGGSEDENEWIQLTQNRWTALFPQHLPFILTNANTRKRTMCPGPGTMPRLSNHALLVFCI